MSILTVHAMETITALLQVIVGVCVLLWIANEGIGRALKPFLTLIKDAHRYRWLRVRMPGVQVTFIGKNSTTITTPKALDTEIDQRREIEDMVLNPQRMRTPT